MNVAEMELPPIGKPIRRASSSTISASSFFRRHWSSQSVAIADNVVDNGLRQVSTPTGTPQATLIFVHGLGGHPTKTWSFRRDPAYVMKFWQREWLRTERGMEDVRICTFGYPADWAAPKDSSLTILDFAKHLNFEILVQDLTDASILYVVHSMGGLVVKKAYMLSLQDPMYSGVASSVRRGAMLFLGTPHRGSDSASALHKFLSLTIGIQAFYPGAGGQLQYPG